MAKPPVQVNIFSLLSPYPNDPNKYLHSNPLFLPIPSFRIFSLAFSVSIFFTVVLGFLQKIKSCDHIMRKPCCDKQDTNKGAWSKQEDQKLIDYIRKHGEGCWRTLPQAAGLLRCGKSCRLRWINYLRPDLKRGNFAEDEEDLIIKLHALLGNRWSLIAGRLPGRTDNEVKNYWNSHLRRKLINMGIDPNNHKLYHSLPRPQNPNNSTSATSSGLKVETNHQSTVISHVGGGVDNDQASDAGSCLDDESCGLPDLNLDLSITIPSTPSPGKAKEEKNTNELNIKEQEFGPSPTLVLFQ